MPPCTKKRKLTFNFLETWCSKSLWSRNTERGYLEACVFRRTQRQRTWWEARGGGSAGVRVGPGSMVPLCSLQGGHNARSRCCALSLPPPCHFSTPPRHQLSSPMSVLLHTPYSSTFVAKAKLIQHQASEHSMKHSQANSTHPLWISFAQDFCFVFKYFM